MYCQWCQREEHTSFIVIGGKAAQEILSLLIYLFRYLLIYLPI
jgi:hypothetical protein